MPRSTGGSGTRKPVRVRTAGLEDVEKVVGLLEEWSPCPEGGDRRKTAVRAIEDCRHEILVAEVDGRVVGLLEWVMFHDLLEGSDTATILSLYVAESHRRMGVGEALVKETVRRAKERGASEIHVCAERANKPALSLYRKCGFGREYVCLEMELRP